MQYFIIKKLDDADSQRVEAIVARIRNVASAVNWEEVGQPEDAELFIAVGGDGTMLHAMRLSKEFAEPALGFNIGKIGFLAEFQPESVAETIIAIANGKFKIEDRSILHESSHRKNAINEFVISPVLAKDTIKYEFFVDGISSGAHHANGLIISTPTGSTAYSLSVGGAILQPDAGVFQITPIAAMSLNSRSVVVSENSKVTVKLSLRDGVKYNLIADGQVISEFDSVDDGGGDDYTPPCKRNDRMFQFSKANQPAILMHGADWNFFEVLHKKLSWNTAV